MRTSHIKRSAVGLLSAVAITLPVHALDLVGDLQKAMRYDPTFQTAVAQRQANLAASSQASASYYPSASLNNSRMATDSSSRTTVSVTQPLIDLDKFATLKQAKPREGFAEATYLVSYQDLASRLLKATNAIVLSNETIKLNDSKITALNQQALAAKKKLELGQGTITDQRDIEVKAAQAKAQQISFKNQLEVALKQYAAITGERPNVAEFVLPERHKPYALKPLTDYIDSALKSNPSITAARFSERVAELDVDKSTGALLPTVNAQFSDSKSATVNNRYTAVVVSMPLQAGTYYARAGVVAGLEKARESRRESEEKAKVEIERLRSQLDSGDQALAIQQDAVSAALLSVEANTRSYEGGVRSAVDVLNATQTVFQVKSDYVSLVTSQAESLLVLMNLHTVNPEEALQTAFKYLFVR